MNTTRIPPFVYHLLLLLIVIFSFYNFADINFPFLNSNMAVNSLMAQGLNFPGDFYSWGQDRGGSLVAMLANLLVEAYKFPPVMAVSFIHYFILIAGFFALASFFRNRNLRLIFALIWFFPCWHFLAQVTSLFGIQMSLTVIALYALRRLQLSLNLFFRIVWLSAACLSFLLAVWVSDLALISLFILAVIVFWKYTPRMKEKGYLFFLKDKTSLVQTILAFVWLIIGTAFILYAKHKATRIETIHINTLNHPGEIITTFKAIGYSLWSLFIFHSDNFMESIYTWAVLGGVPVVISLSYTRIQFIKYLSLHKWLSFFLLNAIITLGFLIISHWVFLKGISPAYFSLVYISAWIAFLFYIDASGSGNRQLRMIILLIIVLLGTLSSFNKLFFPRQLTSRLTQLEAFRSLGDCGLITSYGLSYVTACVDPKHIVATPNDKDHVRNYYYAESVFKMPKFYLMRDGWMNSFPDTLTQFGHILCRKGTEFTIGDYNLCRYERVFYKRTFSGDEMQHQGKIVADPSAFYGKSLVIDNNFDHKKHFIFGPFLSLKQGTILVRYSLKSEPAFNTRTLAVLEISAEYGKKILATLPIRSCDFQRHGVYQFFDLKTTLDKDYNGVEFRIMYQGGPDLCFDRVELTGM
jgi:hypothetical protein